MQANSEVTNGKAVITLQGRFDFSAHRAFRGSCAGHIESADVTEVEVDLKGVNYVDSSALGMLLLLRERAIAANKRISLRNSHGVVKQVLDVANFGKLFQLT
jgi:anti-anti-sigma factor